MHVTLVHIMRPIPFANSSPTTTCVCCSIVLKYPSYAARKAPMTSIYPSQDLGVYGTRPRTRRFTVHTPFDNDATSPDNLPHRIQANSTSFKHVPTAPVHRFNPCFFLPAFIHPNPHSVYPTFDTSDELSRLPPPTISSPTGLYHHLLILVFGPE